jgi:hypothetical protein
VVSLVIVNPPLLTDELDDSDYQDDEEQHPRDGGRHTEIEESEACSYRYRTIVVVALPGPPPVSTSAWVKT